MEAQRAMKFIEPPWESRFFDKNVDEKIYFPKFESEKIISKFIQNLKKNFYIHHHKLLIINFIL